MLYLLDLLVDQLEGYSRNYPSNGHQQQDEIDENRLPDDASLDEISYNPDDAEAASMFLEIFESNKISSRF